MEARRSVWIATANLKELMVEDHRAVPGRRRTLRVRRARRPRRLPIDPGGVRRAGRTRRRAAHPARGAAVAPVPRHARAPARRSARALALRACPRVHFKAVVVDGAFVYVGSANWTGAGLGAKGTGRRNFELGFAGSDDGLLDRVQELFDRVWRGAECKGCKLRDVCPAPLDDARKRAPRARDLKERHSPQALRGHGSCLVPRRHGDGAVTHANDDDGIIALVKGDRQRLR